MSEKIQKRFDFIINCIYVLLVVGLVYVIFKYGLGLVMPFILALGLVAMTQPLIRGIQRKVKIKQKFLSVLFLLIVYALLVVGIVFIVWQVIQLFITAFTVIPKYFQESVVQQLQSILNSLEETFGITSWGAVWTEFNEKLLAWLQEVVITISQKGLELLTGFTGSIPSYLIGILFTVMLSFSISMQYDKVLLFFKTQLPDKAKTFLGNLKLVIVDAVFKYIKGFLILMVITFVELSVGLLIIRIPNAVGIAAMIAVFDALPILGTGAIMIPWILIELFQQNYELALGLGIVYGIVTVVRNIIEPKIIGGQLGLNPIASLMFIYLGYRLLGFIGMIVFPVLGQILLALHKNGSIRLYKEIPEPSDSDSSDPMD